MGSSRTSAKRRSASSRGPARRCASCRTARCRCSRCASARSGCTVVACRPSARRRTCASVTSTSSTPAPLPGRRAESVFWAVDTRVLFARAGRLVRPGTESERCPMLRSIQLPRPFSRAGGHAFIAKIPEQFLPALHSSSVGIVAEDGRTLGPAGTVHQQIRDEGRGAFSVWGTHVYLSASDNSDCESNARAYSLIAVDLSEPSLRDELARNDDFLLDLLHRNGNHSSSLVSNFFGYYKSLHVVLQRNGLPLPRRVMEIGSGTYPYTALRFLAAGVELFVAND